MRKNGYKILGFISLVVASVSTSYADILPGPAQSEQVGRALTKAPATTATPILPPAIVKPKEAPSPLTEQAKKIKFKLNKIILKGNHVYSNAVLRTIYAKQLGKNISVADLFNIVQEITNFYRNNGYILSRAVLPPQRVRGGVVKIQVIEGYIDQVDVRGAAHGAKCLVKAMGEKVVMCHPLNVSRMQKFMLLMNEIPSTQVKAVLAPSKNQTGAADLTLVTQNQPITGYFSYDNYGTRYIGPQQMTGNVGFNSMLLPGDATQLTITKTPKGGELSYGDLNYSTALDAYGDRVLVGATGTQTEPQFVLQPFDIRGLTTNLYATVSYPAIRTLKSSLTWRTGFNYLDTYTTSIPDHSNLYTDHVRSLDLGGTYAFTDSWYGSNQVIGDFRQGLPIMGYTQDTDPATAQTSNPGGRANYTKVTAQVNRLQLISGPWTIYGVANGQWAFNPLLASEQFTAGGSVLGRGYDPAEIIGDRGASGSLELRYDWAVGNLNIQTLQLYTFYDAGVAWNLEVPPGRRQRTSITSVGVGTRFFMNKYVSGNIMWAQPLTKPVLTEQEQAQVVVNGVTENVGNGMAPRVFFSIVAMLD